MTDNTTIQSNTIVQAYVIKTEAKKCPTCGNAYNNNSTTCPNEVHRVTKEQS